MKDQWDLHQPITRMGNYLHDQAVRRLRAMVATNDVDIKAELKVERDDLLHALRVIRKPVVDNDLHIGDLEFIRQSRSILYDALVHTEGELVSMCDQDELAALIFG